MLQFSALTGTPLLFLLTMLMLIIGNGYTQPMNTDAHDRIALNFSNMSGCDQNIYDHFHLSGNCLDFL